MNSTRLQSGTMDYPNCWGMYSKKHLGLSRIIDQTIGLIADFPLSVGRVQPACFIPPDANFGYMPIVGGERRAKILAVPENVMPDFSTFSLRYFLDQHGDYCLATYHVIDQTQVSCELTFYNHSDQPRDYYYNLGTQFDHQVPSVTLKDSLQGHWIPAYRYSEINSYIQAFTSGSKQCITNYSSFGIEKGQLAESFGCWDGDSVTYQINLTEDHRRAFLYFRYIKYGTASMRWKLRTGNMTHEFEFPQTCSLDSGAWGKSDDYYHEWKVLPVDIGPLTAGVHRFEFSTIDPPNYDISQIWLDGFFISPNKLHSNGNPTLLDSDLLTVNHDNSASISMESQTENAVSLSVDAVGQQSHIHIAALQPNTFAQTNVYRTQCYSDSLIQHISQPATCNSGKSAFNVKSSTITVAPHKTKTIKFSIVLLCNENQSQSPQYVSGCYGTQYPAYLTSPTSPYQDLIKYFYDASWFNLCFPTTIQDHQTPFIAPAKEFPTPFSWDAGFAMLGMAELCPELCAAGTAFYLAPKDSPIPFIYYGSPVPTQFYAIWSLFANQQCKNILQECYPRLLKMYEFYMGRHPQSSTNLSETGLLSTYKYNYSLGIDDHPIQMWAYKNNKIKNGVYPLILISQILRAAKIMRNITYILDRRDDLSVFNKDIHQLQALIENQMWDESSGFYNWLYNDNGVLRQTKVDNCSGDRSGCSFLPMFAGIDSHQEKLIETLTDPKRFWTSYGVSSVDMQAPYFTPSGYWNGGIWPVMNWYIWRAMIEAGQTDIARKIAIRILDTWAASFREEHYCGEHFNITRKQMEGVPNFTGLDTTIVEMHNAYFKPYTVTLPYDAWLTCKTVNDQDDSLRFTLHTPFSKQQTVTLIAVMKQPHHSYSVNISNHKHLIISDKYGCCHFPYSTKNNDSVPITITECPRSIHDIKPSQYRVPTRQSLEC